MGIQFILPSLWGPFSAHVIRFMIPGTMHQTRHGEYCTHFSILNQRDFHIKYNKNWANI